MTQPEHWAVRRLTSRSRSDFYTVHCDPDGSGWCACAAWWVPSWDGWGERSGDDNRRVREGLFDQGEHDGYLLYRNGTPVGWCQVGPRDRLEKLVRQFGLGPDPRAWAITCFQVAESYRRQGLAARLLQAVIADIPDRGAHTLEAFPKRGPRLNEADLWNGPEEMFIRAGFRVVRDDAVRPVLRLDL